MAENMRQGMDGTMLPPAPSCPGGRTYVVRSGDTLFQIARSFDIPLASLIAANPQIPDQNLIYPGQVVCIPGEQRPPMSCPNGLVYTVRQGDTLFAIARRHGISLETLRAANPQITNPDLIYPGQAICIPEARPPVACKDGMPYTVVPGDTLFDIATSAGISLQALLAANPQITDPNRIFPGQMICIPGAVTPPAPVVISPVVSPIQPPMAPPEKKITPVVSPALPPAVPPVTAPAKPVEPPPIEPAPCPAHPVMPAFPCPFMPRREAIPCPVAPIPVEPAKSRRRARRRRFCCFC